MYKVLITIDVVIKAFIILGGNENEESYMCRCNQKWKDDYKNL